MKHSLILGGTKGLGLALAVESSKRGFAPIITGRSAGHNENIARAVPGSKQIMTDLTEPSTLQNLDSVHDLDVPYFFGVSGQFLRKRFVDVNPDEKTYMIALHLGGFTEAIRIFQVAHNKPYHLVVIASTSSWRLRNNETLYCMLEAAKAAFAREFANELFRDLPGSKVTLVNPGGMKTPDFYKGTGQDISEFMEPADVAKIIWDDVQKQKENYLEIQIMRGEGGVPIVTYGPRLPEIPA